MRIRTASSLLIGTAMLFAVAAPAAAQGNLGAGLAFLNDSDADEMGVGLAVDYGYDVHSMGNRALALVGDFSWANYEFFTARTLQGGLRYRMASPTSRVNPFAQVLLGMYSWAAKDVDDIGSTEFAISPAGGVEIGVNDRAAVRAQVDFPIIMYEGDPSTYFRVFLGLSFPLGAQ